MDSITTDSPISVQDVVHDLTHNSKRIRRRAMRSFLLAMDLGTPVQRRTLGLHLVSVILLLLYSPHFDVRLFALNVVRHINLNGGAITGKYRHLLLGYLRESETGPKHAALVWLRSSLRRGQPLRTYLILYMLSNIRVVRDHLMAFISEILPPFVRESLEKGAYGYIWPFAFHEEESIRAAVLPLLIQALRSFNRLQHCVGFVESAVMDGLKPMLSPADIPTDIRRFIFQALPNLVLPLALSNRLTPLVHLVGHQDVAISQAATDALRCLLRSPGELKHILIQAHILGQVRPKLLSKPWRPHIIEFTQQMLPALAIQIVQNGEGVQLVAFMSHPCAAICEAARTAALLVSQSSSEDRQSLVDGGILATIRNISTGYATMREMNFIVEIIPNLALAFSEFVPHCEFLLDLLSNSRKAARDAGIQAIQAIVGGNPSSRTTFRNTFFQKINLAAQGNLLRFACSTKAAPLYDDFLKVGELPSFLNLLCHCHYRIRVLARGRLAQPIKTSQQTSSDLVEAGILDNIVSAAVCGHNEIPKWFLGILQPHLVAKLSQNPQRIVTLLRLTDHNARTFALSLVETIVEELADANSTINTGLLDEIFTGLSNDDSFIQHLCTVLPRIATSVVRTGGLERIVGLLLGPNPRLQAASTKAIEVVIRMSFNDRRSLSVLFITETLASLSPTIPSLSDTFWDVICADAIQEECFEALFAFLTCPYARLQSASMFTLSNALSFIPEFSERLLREGFLRHLLEIIEDPTLEAILFASGSAIPIFGPCVAGRGHCSELLRLSHHASLPIKQSALAVLSHVAETDTGRMIVDQNLVVRISAALRDAGTELVLQSASLYPVLKSRIQGSSDVDRLLNLLSVCAESHVALLPQKSLQLILNSSPTSRKSLLQTLDSRLPIKEEAEIQFFCEVIAFYERVSWSAEEGSILLNLMSNAEPSITETVLRMIRLIYTTGSTDAKRAVALSGALSVLWTFHLAGSLNDTIISVMIFALPQIVSYATESSCFTKDIARLFRIRDVRLSEAVPRALRLASANLPAETAANLLQELLETSQTLHDPDLTETINSICTEFAEMIVEIGRLDILGSMLSHPEFRVSRKAHEALVQVSSSHTTKDVMANSALFLSNLCEAFPKQSWGCEASLLSGVISNIASKSPSRSQLILQSALPSILVGLMNFPASRGPSLTAIVLLIENAMDSIPFIRTGLLNLLGTLLPSAWGHDLISELTTLRVSAIAASQPIGLDSSIRTSLVSVLEAKRDDVGIPKEALSACNHLAKTEVEVQQLISAGVLPCLVQYLHHSEPDVVAHACAVLETIDRAGNFRQAIKDAGAYEALRIITSPFRSSTMSRYPNKPMKKEARAAAASALKAFENPNSRTISQHESPSISSDF